MVYLWQSRFGSARTSFLWERELKKEVFEALQDETHVLPLYCKVTKHAISWEMMYLVYVARE